MRDLGARLREIVQRERRVADRAAVSDASGLRELTYVPDGAVSDARRPLETLGGTALTPEGTCLEVERRYPCERSHGRQTLDACRPSADLPLVLVDPVVGGQDAWWRQVVFFDIETTGLSGGAGTIAFLAGCGRFEESAFVVRQFFLVSPSGERAMLQALAEVFNDASMIVSYNGRTFDVPFMETRWAFHRTGAPTDDVPHFDMLPVARRLWRRREVEEDGGCSLSTLERAVLGFHRENDVSGFEIPARYFQFMRTGDASLVEGVLEHNRNDLVSLAVIMGHALWLVREGPSACRDPREQLALGRIYERAGNREAALGAYDMASRLGDTDVRREALARIAEEHRRSGDHERAARVWESVLELVDETEPVSSAWERRAVEALAIHHEHRVRDLDVARRYARALETTASGRTRTDVERRLRRLDQKLDRRGKVGENRLRYDG